MAPRRRANPRWRSRHPQPATMAPASGSKKCLMDLPPELRNSIYEMAVLKDKLFDDGNTDIYYKRFKIPEPGLLRVCKQIRDEALPIFYGDNIFRCANMYSTVKFLCRLSPRKLAALRTVHCSVFTGELVYSGYLESLKAVVRRFVKDFRDSKLHLDAIRIPIRIRGEPQSRYVSCQELEDYESFEVGHREAIRPK
ncbi:hypothetical protein PRZ48_014411 [Zasmidium cellare]|uniref:Uncharacterized protein n=1 Tax=Zasmidium cellare TaxID=395010 RepID=A0ABR0DYX2_ZASCE|nr:hypothetical protein PRZ48_014411 [Zasmidium cellare]